MPTEIEEEGALDTIEALIISEEDPNAGPKLFRAFALCKEFVSCGRFSHWTGWKLKGRLLNVGRCCVSNCFGRLR